MTDDLFASADSDPLDLIGTLLKAHEELAARVVALEGDGEAAAATEPHDLDEWVGWLIPTYSLQVVLDDWQANPAIVLELTALMRAHSSVKPKGFDAVVWHGHLASMVQRIHALRERTSRDQPSDDRQDLDEWVAWLIPTYSLQVVLEDWRTIPAIVRELNALLKAHLDVIGKPKGFDDVVWHGHLGSMVQRIEALRRRASQDRERAATHGGALASILRRNPANGAETEPIPTESG